MRGQNTDLMQNYGNIKIIINQSWRNKDYLMMILSYLSLLLYLTLALIKVKIVYNFGLSECNRIQYLLPPHVGPFLAGRFSHRVRTYV